MQKRYLLFLLMILVVHMSIGVNVASGPIAQTAVPLPITASTPTTTYIIQLSRPPLATWLHTQKNLSHDLASETAVSYQSTLINQQQELLGQMGRIFQRNIMPHFQYTTAYNGIAVSLSGAEAAEVGDLPGVTAVWRDREYELLTDAGPDWIGAGAIWDGSGTPDGVPSKGEGIIIGVIDTGVNTDHPSFADIGGDGYNHTNPLGSGVYKGLCTGTPALCNDKLIGLWDFADGWGEADGAEDSAGHGSHTASTAAGNVISANLETPTGYAYTTIISGVAPHANLIAYDACVTGCPGSALLAAINQAVADGVDVINYSISGSGDPYHDPISQAFLAANDAGIFVAASAGNNGPGAATLSHLAPWLTAVAANSHNRSFTNTLTDLNSSGGSLGDITGQSITTGYGPAPIVYAADFGDGLCLTDFAPGTWSGEIVICDRGQIARIEKGVHVLSGGAGGLILANEPENAASIISDAHVLPALHITYNDGAMLKTWLTTGTNHIGRIQGTAVILDAPGDVLAGFSSRGPNTAFDLLKPDLAAPGIDILAAQKTTSPVANPEFGLLSGTSMAAPHVSGAAALLTAVHPSWTPDEIRSALMMTGVIAGLTKETGLSAADAFDVGAGRVNLNQAAGSGLVLHETLANYNASDPFSGGDPRTLNVPGLMNSSCFQTCTWTRTVRSVLDVPATWTVTAIADSGLQIAITPNVFTIGAGLTQTVQITADVTTYFGSGGWGFGTIQLTSPGQPPLHMPLAVNKTTADHPDVLSKSGPAYAAPDQIVTYQIELHNPDSIAHTFQLTDMLPAGAGYVPGSATGGLIYDSINRRLTWSGTVGAGEMGYEVTAVTPLPYVNLGAVDSPPSDLCTQLSDCDEGTAVFDLTGSGDSFTFYDDTLTTLNVSTNGFIFGPDGLSGAACVACPQRLPTADEPNQLIAGLWRDADMSGGNGQWYGAVLVGLLSDPNDRVFYTNWHNAGQSGNPFLTGRYAIAMMLDGQSEPAGRIYMIFDHIADRATLIDVGYSIGVENRTGNNGVTYAFAPCHEAPCLSQAVTGAPPVNGTTLRFDPAIVAGPNSKLFTYQVQITGTVGDLLTNEVVVTSDGSVGLATAVTGTQVEYRRYFPIVSR